MPGAVTPQGAYHINSAAQIDWSHSIAQDLMQFGCGPYSFTDRSRIGSFHSQAVFNMGTGGWARTTWSPWGTGITVGREWPSHNPTYFTRWYYEDTPVPQSYTLYAKVYLPSLYMQGIAFTYSPGWGDAIEIGVGNTSFSTLGNNLVIGDSGTDRYSDAIGLGWHTIAISVFPGVVINCFIDGRLTDQLGAGSMTSNTDAFFALGGGNYGGLPLADSHTGFYSFFGAGEVAVWGFWGRGLSVSEHIEMHRDPYQIMRRR